MIRRIHLCFNHAVKVQGLSEFLFSPGVNILVGPNGSGKSTVLRALYSCTSCKKETSKPSSVHYFDTETMNPHTRTGAPGNMTNMLLKTRGRFSSHGQILKAALVSLPICSGDVLLIDEPEAAQDFSGVEDIRKDFETICAKRGQVIAASHHPAIWREANIIELVPGYVEEVIHDFSVAVCSFRVPPKRRSSQNCEAGLGWNDL